MEIVVTLLTYLAPLLATIITILAVAGVKKLLDKWGIERSERIDAMIQKYVSIGVESAEVAATKWAQQTGGKMSSGSKKAKALNTVMRELEQSGVTKVAEELIVDRIESYLNVSGRHPGIPSDPQAGESV